MGEDGGEKIDPEFVSKMIAKLLAESRSRTAEAVEAVFSLTRKSGFMYIA